MVGGGGGGGNWGGGVEGGRYEHSVCEVCTIVGVVGGKEICRLLSCYFPWSVVFDILSPVLSFCCFCFVFLSFCCFVGLVLVVLVGGFVLLFYGKPALEE